MTLLQYLTYCHDIVCNDGALLNDLITIIRFCCSHKMKNFVEGLGRDAPEIAKNKEEKKFILKSLGSLFMCQDYASVQVIFRLLFTILLNQYVTQKVQDAIDILNQVIKPVDDAHISDVDEPLLCDLNTSEEAVKDEMKEDTIEGSAMYQSSPFYIDMQKIYAVEAKLAAQTEKPDVDDPDCVQGEPDSASNFQINEKFSPKFAETLLKKHCPTLCLWTAIIRRTKFPKDPIRISNAVCECWMKILKRDILSGETLIRPNRFWEMVRKIVLNFYKEVTLDMPATACAQEHPKKPINEGKKNQKAKSPCKPPKTIKKKYLKTKPISLKEAALGIPSKGCAQQFPSKSKNGGKKVDKVKTQPPRKTIVKKTCQKPKSISLQSFAAFFATQTDSVRTEEDFPAEDLEEKFRKERSAPSNNRYINTFLLDKEVLFPAPQTETAPQAQRSSASDKSSSNHKNESLLPLTNGVSVEMPLVDNVQCMQSKTFATTSVADYCCTDSCVFLPNGLNCDPSYYSCLHRRDVGQIFNYFISKFSFHSFGGIHFQDFFSLNPGVWLNGYIIDAVAELYIKKENCEMFSYIPTIHSSDILDGSPSELAKRQLSVNLFKKEFIILFYNKRRYHWCLVVVHVTRKVFYFIDPMETFKDGELRLHQKYMKNFLSFFKSSFSGSTAGLFKGWYIDSVPHILQRDSCNCGIFSLFYMICTVKNGYPIIHDSMIFLNRSLLQFNPDRCRNILQTFLLNESENVLDVCAGCGKPVLNTTSAVKCVRCLRKVHDKPLCLNFFESNTPSLSAICLLCSRFEASKSIELLSQGTIYVPNERMDSHNPSNELSMAATKLSQKTTSNNYVNPFIPQVKALSPAQDELCDADADYAAKFWFQDYLDPMTAPVSFNYVPRMQSARFIGSTDIPLYVARNPFPSSQIADVKKPWCFSILGNGVIDYVDYYIQVPQEERKLLNYPVADMNIPGLPCGHLYYHDFASLNKGQAIFEIVVNIIAHLFIKMFCVEEYIYYINVSKCKALLSKSSCCGVNIAIPNSCQYIAMMHEEKKLWSLIIISRSTGAVTFYDPSSKFSKSNEIEEIMFHLSMLNDIYFFAPNIRLVLQKVGNAVEKKLDSSNSGPYCLYFLEQFLSQGVEQCDVESNVEAHNVEEWRSSQHFQPDVYRDYLKRTILWHSEDISTICCICNIDDKKVQLLRRGETHHFIRCMSCERPVHLRESCLLMPEKIGDVQDWAPSYFLCVICRAHEVEDPLYSRSNFPAVSEEQLNEERLHKQKLKRDNITYDEILHDFMPH